MEENLRSRFRQHGQLSKCRYLSRKTCWSVLVVVGRKYYRATKTAEVGAPERHPLSNWYMENAGYRPSKMVHYS
ncbi:unnamed protein product [Calypogeia fissa]